MKKRCVNRKCGDEVKSNELLCPACRFLARWAFGAGCFLAGLAWGAIQVIEKLK